MRRRTFLGAAIAAAAGLLGAGAGTSPAAAPKALLAVHRWTGKGWVRCRMAHLRAGDVFRLEDVGTFRAAADPDRCEWPDGSPGNWGITADYRIDPATNEWVTAGVPA
jgi:hypothetical protein